MAYKRPQLTPEEEIARIRLPKQGEIFAVALEMLGAGKFRVECEDGFTRLCRIPGRLRRRAWVRVGDLVVIKPWVVQENERCDLVWRYTRTQAQWLKRQKKFNKITYG